MKLAKISSALLFVGLLTQAPVVMAGATWNLTTGCSTTTGFGNTRTCGSVSAKAWSTTTSTGLNSTTFSTAEVKYGTGWGGVGIRNRGESGTSPDHSVDNATPGKDLLMLSFGAATALTDITLGWVSGDSDLSVLAYTGTGTPATLSGKSAANLLSSGWSLVSQVSGGGSTGTRTFNTDGAVSSSWWLISAYNSAFGGTALDSVADYVKVLSVASNVVKPPPGGKTPEPASLALVGLGMLGLWGAKRRARKASAA